LMVSKASQYNVKKVQENKMTYKIKLITLFISLLSLNGCMEDDGLYSASLIQLIATPEKFIGKTVYFQGYFDTASFGVGVYLTEKDAKMYNTASSISLMDVVMDQSDWKKFKCDHMHVTVKGKFDVPKETGIPAIVKTFSIFGNDIKEGEDGYCWPLKSINSGDQSGLRYVTVMLSP